MLFQPFYGERLEELSCEIKDDEKVTVKHFL